MAITVALVDATPHRLAYLATCDGVVSSPPVLADRRAIVPNAGGATPDLRTDMLSIGTAPGVSGIPLRPIIRANLDGIGPIAAGAVTAAVARAILLLDDPTPTVLTNELVPRAVVRLTPRTGAGAWFVDINQNTFEDSPPGVNGNPILIVGLAATVAATALVEILALHSVNQ